MPRILVALVLFAAACNSAKGGEQVKADASGSAGTLGSLAEYLNVECPWQSSCSAVDLELCYSFLAEEQSFLWFPAWLENGLQERFECLKAASSCADYMACRPEEPIIQGPVDSFSCPGDRDNVCDNSTKIALWCLGVDSNPAEAGTPPLVVYPLGPVGMSCDGDIFADEPHVACEGVLPYSCEGAVVHVCNDNGNEVSWNCGNGHPDFV